MTARTSRTAAERRAELAAAARRFGVPMKAIIRETPLDYVRTVEAEHRPPESWVRELREISPVSAVAPYLAFHWLAGTDTAPIERWVLYSYIPVGLIPSDMRALLEAEPYWTLPASQQHGRRTMVSALQWHLYREYRVWARPFWCLQGTQGGTPARYTMLEANLLKLAGLPHEPDAPGSLPYVGWDERAARAVRRRDKLAAFGGRVEALEAAASSEAQKAEAAEMERAFRKEFVAWQQERTAELADAVTSLSRKTDNDPLFRPATREEANRTAEAMEQYVDTGILL